MENVKISPKFQVVIPKAIRNELKLVAGQKMHIMAYGKQIVLIPERTIAELRGFLRGIDTNSTDQEADRV